MHAADAPCHWVLPPPRPRTWPPRRSPAAVPPPPAAAPSRCPRCSAGAHVMQVALGRTAEARGIRCGAARACSMWLTSYKQLH